MSYWFYLRQRSRPAQKVLRRLGDIPVITLTINGRRRELEGPTSLIDFLHDSGVNLQFVAVAHNREVVEKERFPQIMLDEGDEVEVVRPVGGG